MNILLMITLVVVCILIIYYRNIILYYLINRTIYCDDENKKLFKIYDITFNKVDTDCYIYIKVVTEAGQKYVYSLDYFIKNCTEL